MSIRWMAVQYVGDTLRLPVVNEGDMDKPFGSSALERDVKRIVVNPFSDSPQTFVPELENDKLRELVRDMWEGYNDPQCEECHLKDTPTCADCPICAKEASVLDRMCELGIEVTK